MNNLGTISKVIHHIENEYPNYNGPMVEITLRATSETAKSRLLYVLGYNDESFINLRPIIENSIRGEDYECEFDFKHNIHEFIRKYSMCNRPSVEANWRGRLFYYADLEQATNQKVFLLRSFWRIIVTRDAGGKFYTRHEIHPAFWKPGFSIAGQETFSDEVQRVLDGLQNRRQLFIDERNDFIRVFAKKHNVGAFQNVPLTQAGVDEVYEFRFQDVANLSDIAGTINERLKAYFI